MHVAKQKQSWVLGKFSPSNNRLAVPNCRPCTVKIKTEELTSPRNSEHLRTAAKWVLAGSNWSTPKTDGVILLWNPRITNLVRRLGCTQILTRNVLIFQGLALVAVYLGVFENGGTTVVGKMMINHWFMSATLKSSQSLDGFSIETHGDLGIFSCLRTVSSCRLWQMNPATLRTCRGRRLSSAWPWASQQCVYVTYTYTYIYI